MTREKAFQPGTIQYDQIAPNYSAARAFSADSAQTWAQVIEPFIPRSRPATVLDLGCGTGRFTKLIAERFPVRVIGVDRSFGMLQQARENSDLANVLYSAGSAEELPLASASCDLAWMSQVIHHVVDRPACAKELRRVIRSDGHLLIRGAFGDRLDSCPTYFRFFPSARRITSQVPTIRDILGVFRASGFRFSGFQSIDQKTCNSLRELAERTRLRADTTLVLISNAEFERCQAELERAAAMEQVPEPVIETVDLLILKPNG